MPTPMQRIDRVSDVAGEVDEVGGVIHSKTDVPDVLIRFGSEKPEEGEATSFTSVDVGFNVGVGYTF